MAQKDEQQLASLYMKDGVVELKGFDMLKNSTRISFHLMPGGIVINNRDLPESPTCFTCECEADLKIKDKLKEKGRTAILPFSHLETMNEFR